MLLFQCSFIDFPEDGGFTTIKKIQLHDVSKLKMNMIIAVNLIHQAEQFNQVRIGIKGGGPYQ
jgi:hypothetical protein